MEMKLIEIIMETKFMEIYETFPLKKIPTMTTFIKLNEYPLKTYPILLVY